MDHNDVDTPKQAGSPFKGSPCSTVVMGGVVVAGVTLLFLFTFWNRFLGLRSGDGGYTPGLWLLHGILPYRDYYAPIPPLYIGHCAAVLSFLGHSVIALRGFGVFERVVLSLILYAWMARFFRVRDAAIASVVTVIVSAGDYADPISSYNHFTILLAMAAGFVASFGLDEGRSNRFLLTTGVLSGLFSTASLASKQTIGLAVCIAVPTLAVLCLQRFGSVQGMFRFFGGFIVGSVAVLGALLGWLAHLGILRAFFYQTFVLGSRAKAAHPIDFAVHSWLVLKLYWWAAAIACAIIALSWTALRSSERGTKPKEETPRVSLSALLALLVLAVVAIKFTPAFVSLPFPEQFAAKAPVYVAFAGSGVLIVYYCGKFLRRTLTRRQAQFWMIAAVSFATASMLSLSFPLFEAMAVPGLALFLAVMLDAWPERWKVPVYASCFLLVLSQTEAKLGMPFGFEQWFEPPVHLANTPSTLPELKGLRLSPGTADFADSVTQIIRQNSKPEDTIFIYPELALFYGLSGRRAATFSLSHNIDVTADDFAREEARRLLQARPAVLIYGQKPPGFIQSEEAFWRRGRPSGLRDLTAAVEVLARQYRLQRVYRLYPYGNPVYVLVRPDTVAQPSRR